MTDYLYRGTSLTAANNEEFANGRIEGYEVNIYRGRLDMFDPQETVARGTSIKDVQWWKPKGEDRGYLKETQGVTGGLSDIIGTAIGFSSGVPLVLYLNRRALNGTGAKIRYGYDWFDHYEGALAWVYGRSVSGEIRTMDNGLMGLTTETPQGPQVWEWGHRDLNGAAMAYEDEQEVLVMDDHIDIAGACESVALILEGRRTPTQALATFDGYHAGFGGDGEDTSRWRTERVLDTLHHEIQQNSAMRIDDLWTINLTTAMLEKANVVPRNSFDFAYNGTRVIENYDAVPSYLMGAAGGMGGL